MNNRIYERHKTIQLEDGRLNTFDDYVAIESPITFVINGKEFATIVCTPSDLRELVIGFLASEGVIRFVDDIQSIQIDEKRGFAYIELSKKLEQLNLERSKRHIGSCCGVSRQFYFKTDVLTAKTITYPLSISAYQCLHLMAQLQARSDHFKKTGGVHNAGLCTVNEVLQIRTDIGRHNALDKIHGYILENNIYVRDKIIVFSGRVSSEVLLKIAKMGISIIVSTSAPTNLALELAEDLRITIVGFTRGNRMNIYTHWNRISDLNNDMKNAEANK